MSTKANTSHRVSKQDDEEWKHDIEARLERLDTRQVFMDTKLSSLAVEHDTFRHTVAALSNGFNNMDKFLNTELAAIKRDKGRNDFWTKVVIGLVLFIMFLLIVN